MKKFLEIIFPELKYYNFYWKYSAINWRDHNNPMSKACRAAHYPWWERLLFAFGIGLELKREDK